MVGVIYTARHTENIKESLQDAKLDKYQEITQKTFEQIGERIDALTDEQRKHNGVVERMYSAELNIAELKRDSKTVFNNIDGIKEEVKEVKSDIQNLNHSINKIKESEIRLEEQIKNE